MDDKRVTDDGNMTFVHVS